MSMLMQRLEGGSLGDRLKATQKDVRGGGAEMTVSGAGPQGGRTPGDPLAALKFRLHEKLLKQMDVSKLAGQEKRELRHHVEEAARTLLAAEVLGLGPLEPLLEDPSISEVMVNRPNMIYFERAGVLHLSERTFRDDEH